MNKQKIFALGAGILLAVGLAVFQFKANAGGCCDIPECCEMSAGTGCCEAANCCEM